MKRKETKEIVSKTRIILAGLVVVFVLMGVRLFFLQIQSNELFVSRAERNMLRFVSVEATRGEIVDRNGKVFATSKPSYVISLEYLRDREETERAIQNLAAILQRYGYREEEIREAVNANRRKFEATEIARVSWGVDAVTMVSELSEHRADLPGVVIKTEPIRSYPLGSLAGHIIGHMGPITESEYEVADRSLYGINDRVGKSGIEKVFELLGDHIESYGLKGNKGLQQFKVDAASRPVQEMDFTIEPLPGDTIVLTLDHDLQVAMEDALDAVIGELQATVNEKAGSAAAVVIEVNSGRVLAMASRPTFDPNDFTGGLSQELAAYYYQNEMRPEINKAVASAYPPGSTFKMITGMSYLEYAEASPGRTVTCRGAYWEAPYIRCWSSHGTLNYTNAIGRSCNTFFQNAGALAGIDAIAATAEEFGLGTDPGLRDLPSVARGFLPSTDAKFELQKNYYESRLARYERQYAERVEQIEASGPPEDEKEQSLRDALRQRDSSIAWAENTFRFEQQWRPYDTFNTSIGQGMNNYTALQLANYTATIANGGTRYRPYLVERIVSQGGQIVRQTEPEILNTVQISPENIVHTQRGMRAVLQPGGTAYYLFHDFPVAAAAKTGTAQTGRVGDDPRSEFHGVFVAYAPYEDPEIAYAGIVEYGQQGGRSAGVVARAVFAEYFGEEDYKEIDVGYYVMSPLLEE